MKSVFTILTVLMVLPVTSQSIEKFSIDSGGASSIENNIQLLYTLGEIVVQEKSTPGLSVSEGFINTSFYDTLGTSDNQLSNLNISIYPNPTNRYINIVTDISLSKVELFDVLGKQVFQSPAFYSPIDISQFKAGVYFLRLYKNEKTLIKRIAIL